MAWVLEKLPALLAAELALFCGKGSGRPLQGLCQACALPGSLRPPGGMA